METSFFRLTSGIPLEPAIELLTQVFGPRDQMREGLARWVADPEVSVLGAGELDAISVARIESVTREKNAYATFGETASARLVGQRWGSFQLLAVRPELRRQGLGERLSREQLAWMKERGCAGAIGVCWEHGGTDSSEHLFRRAGFERLGESREFYLEGSRRTGHVCPVCREACRCAATLYGWFWGARAW